TLCDFPTPTYQLVRRQEPNSLWDPTENNQVNNRVECISGEVLKISAPRARSQSVSQQESIVSDPQTHAPYCD
ncbi:hypothetical protein Bpfe_029655, partial [Biomphalaria pfeifferi]